MYYKIARDHLVSAPAEIAGSSGDTYLVTYLLDGMVFSSVPVLDATIFGVPMAGGALGSDSVTFRLQSGQSVAATGLLVLTAQFAISGEGSGSITRTVLNRTLEGISGVDASKTHMAPGIIRAMPALDEKILASDPEPVAMVDTNFLGFGGTAMNPALRTSLGTIVLGVATPNLRNAQAPNDGDATANVAALAEISPAAANATDPMTNPVTFSGDFSFVKTLALTAGGCDGTLGTELRKPSTTDPNMLTDETTPMDATGFGMDQDTVADGNQPYHLCIEADGETAIPETERYMVNTVYKGIENAAFPPMGGMSGLAMITRDGTSVSIPFLVSQEDRYRQRISIVNKSGRSVGYSFMFTPEMGSMAMAGTRAMGTVSANSTVVLDSRDIVTITGNVGRTAATLNLVATPGSVSVGITLVNRNDGSTTMVHAH